MRLADFFTWAMAAGWLTLGGITASAQNYPSKPVRMVTAEPGGGNDFAARLIAPGLSGILGQQVIVDNRGGAAGAIAAQAVAKAPADGYTILLYSSTLWIVPLMRGSAPYDVEKDFLPVTLAATSPNILVVQHPSVPAKSVKDLIALAKGQPGELNYSTGGSGTTPHLAAELFNAMAQVKITRINYKGGGPALNDLIAGHVQLMFPAAGSAVAQVKSGRLRPLAVTGAQPSAIFPNLPTIAAAGLPGYEAGTLQVVFAPTGTPAAIINRLSQAIRQTLQIPDVKDKFFVAGVETVGTTPEQLAATMKSDMARMGKVIKDAGIRID